MTTRLKSLELHGYKTFASSTIFEFSGNITAIVGPNGSGKSNISDAIRWVLGEQAFSLLRGKKTEDMIFTGSELRPRSSMATASIVFNNEDNWLPIDFSEVSITRRAYRDGENEYILNNQKVRLKEINELLAQTGLSERTYTVIGQGLVDAALSLKPDERRKFFEEAAGIDLYRSRREEAFNRLEATKRNLERVYDILSELTPRMHSLERQAKKVQEYERARSELRLLLRDWYGYQWHNVQRELSRTKNILKSHEEQLNLARNILEEDEKRFESFRDQINSIRQNLDQWHENLSVLHLEREQLSKQLAVFVERLSGLKEKNQEKEVQLGISEEEGASLKADLDELIREKSSVAAKLRESEKQASEIKEQLQEKQKAQDEISAKITEKQSRALKLQVEKMSLNAKLVDHENRIRSIKKEMASRQEVKTKFVEEEKLVSAQLDELQSESDKSGEESARVQTKLADLKKQLDQAELEYGNSKEALYLMQAESARYSEQIKMLTDADANLFGGTSGSRELLENVKKGNLSAQLTWLTKDLVIKADYEKAVATVLGEYIDALVCSETDNYHAILDFIDKFKIARTVIFRRQGKEEKKANPAIENVNFIGVLSDFVPGQSQNSAIIKNILGNYLLFKDRESAQKYAIRQSEYCGCVTLSGELFTREDLIIAGQGKSDDRISLPRVMEETKQLLEITENKKDKKIQELQTLEEKKNQYNQSIEEYQKNLTRVKAKNDQINAQRDHNSLRMEQLKQQQNWLSHQQEEDQQKLEDNQAEIIQISKDIEILSRQLEQGNRELDTLSIEKEAMPLQEIQSKTLDFETQNAIFSQSVKNLEVRIAEKQRMIIGTENKIQDLKARMAESQREIDEITTSHAQLMESESRIKERIDALRKKVDPAELELVEKEKEYQADLGRQETQRQSVAAAERLVAQSQLELTRQTGRIENLRERIEDDFGLVAFEYANNVSGPAPLPFEGWVEELPVKDELPVDLEDTISQLRTHLRRMGPINQEAETEFRSTKDRHEFLTQQTEDLTKADADLRQVIANLDELMKKEFKQTFEAVAIQFHEIFSQLFKGGNARLIMTEGEKQNETGVDIEARLPGRREQGLSLLSGGERSLTAVALIFALLRVSPTPFCVLDEVDAMLDESNVGRFCEMLRELSQKTQFIIITHNRNTVQVADVIYGVTMGKDSASQVISLQMDELSEEMAN